MADEDAKSSDNKSEPKQCRICLTGEEEKDSGRLIKPCMCKGSMQYVHVKCLNQWRISSGQQSAFYSCDTCHYSYAFARTLVVGLATSPVVIGVASFLLFTGLVFLSSSVVCYFIPSLATPSYSLEKHYIQHFLAAPITIAHQIIAFSTRTFGLYTYSWYWGYYNDDEWQGPSDDDAPPFNEPRDPSEIGLVARLVHRFVLGLSTVGSLSFIAWIWQMSLLGPLRFFGFRTNSRNNRRDNASGVVTILIIVFIAIGVFRALRNLYRMNRSFAQRLLASVEDVILEVP